MSVAIQEQVVHSPARAETKNLAIVGYGKMGRWIEQLAPEYGFDVRLRLDATNNSRVESLTSERLRGIDVAMEFSTPAAAPENLARLAELGISTVAGTTGWLGELARVLAAVERGGAGLVWSANYSVGMVVFTQIVAETARLLAGEADYGAWAWEIHHAAKKDAPSGTLRKLVEEIKRSGYTRPLDSAASRAGSHPGTHEIGFDSAADTITLRHSARSREGFVRGALRSARWVIGKQGVREFREIVHELGN
jgi:4-hydroxy-tetrahydrodipicolinate reductase